MRAVIHNERAILESIKKSPKTINELIEELGITRPTVMRYVNLLRDQKLIAPKTNTVHRNIVWKYTGGEKPYYNSRQKIIDALRGRDARMTTDDIVHITYLSHDIVQKHMVALLRSCAVEKIYTTRGYCWKLREEEKTKEREQEIDVIDNTQISIDELLDEINISRHTLLKLVDRLTDKKLITSSIKNNNGQPTMYLQAIRSDDRQ